MATFATVTWQPDDEVSSEKLQQMAENEQWAHDNQISAVILYESGVGVESTQVLNLRGRTPGQDTVTKACMSFCTFDTTVPVVEHDVDVYFPPNYFSIPPVCVATVSTGTLPIYPYIKIDYFTDHVQLGLRYIDGRNDFMDGVVNVWAVGR